VIRFWPADSGLAHEIPAEFYSKNNWLMQFQADLVDRPVQRSQTVELSALGAAFAAGLGAGFWSSTEALAGVIAPHDEFQPGMEDDERTLLVSRWKSALASVRTPYVKA
jgi:glycerol kinase